VNYQHAYHAGCVADVFKHIILVQLLQYLQKKPTPFSYIETHAGKAMYDLSADTSQKTLEYQQGIYQLWHNTTAKDAAIIDYLNIIQAENPDHLLKFYPGSGLIAKHCLRAQDEAILCEFHPEVYQELKHYFYHDKQVHTHQRNGYEALPALIPPKNKRGLVLIDPPYEITDEYQQLLTLLQKAQLRWSNGIYAVWFPIKQYNLILDFYHELKKMAFKNILTAEFWTAHDADDTTLKGSGLIIINPPWQFDTLLSALLPDLIKALNLSAGKSQVTWLVKEN
jgi:23S rRNA (adenine2030-N6)-methyltransferase